jgi:hypothetical protein
MRNAYKILMGKTEKKRPLVRLRSRWEDNIRIDIKGIGCESVDWIHLAQDRDGSQEYGNEPSYFIKGREFFD